MGVPCSGCGRQYDVTLFEFGRTIHCTCGLRVGLEPRVRQLGEEGLLTFIADAMLGRLAHWLRILGIDCEHDPQIGDEQLVRRAMDERRVILTRDSSLPDEWRILGIHLVAAKTPIAQLREVVGEFKLAAAVRPFTRCSRCNTLLVCTNADELRNLAQERVPQGILQSQERFSRCPCCERVYWEGSHTDQMREVIDEILHEQED
jgi:hypothetical protein